MFTRLKNSFTTIYSLRLFCTVCTIFCSLLVAGQSLAKPVHMSNYYYAEMAVGVGVYSHVYHSSISSSMVSDKDEHDKPLNTKHNKTTTTNDSMWGSGDINPVFMLGMYSSRYNMAVEVEMGEYAVFERYVTTYKTIDEQGKDVIHKPGEKKPVDSKNKEQAYLMMDYIQVNIRKNLFSFSEDNNYIYLKAGIGAGMINPLLEEAGGMNVPNPLVELGLGFTHRINQHFDFVTYYGVKANIPKRCTLTTGSDDYTFFMPQTLYLGIRMKV